MEEIKSGNDQIYQLMYTEMLYILILEAKEECSIGKPDRKCLMGINSWEDNIIRDLNEMD